MMASILFITAAAAVAVLADLAVFAAVVAVGAVAVAVASISFCCTKPIGHDNCYMSVMSS